MNHEPGRIRTERAVIAVIFRDQELLVIRRSQAVRAPGKVCFPGGGIEAGESPQTALVREVQEELSLAVIPRRKLWQSAAPSGSELNWWLAELVDPTQMPVPDPAEVEQFFWMTMSELAKHPDVLTSYRATWRISTLLNAVRST